MRRGHLRLVRSSPHDGAGDQDSFRVLLVDAHPRVRQGLAALLSACPGVEVAEEAVETAVILRRIARWDPDVMFLGVQLGTGVGLDLVAYLHHEAPDLPIVVLTMQRSAALTRRALERGARGVVLKDHADSELIPAVHAAAAGQTYVSPLIAG